MIIRISPSGSAQGSILVGVLWCLALLSIIVIGVLHTARMDLQVVKNHGDRIQAYYLAIAGIEKAKALLFQDAKDRQNSAKNYTGALYDAPEEFRDVELGRGQFRVFRHGTEEEGGGTIFGIRDEESRMNINYAQPEELAKLPGISPDTMAAILDWRDGDNNVAPGGAEAEYYLSLSPAYVPRNDRLQTVRELLMVRGVSSDLLFGDDADQNGFLDAEEDGTAKKHAGTLNGGWSDIITADSWTRNVNASGDSRVNIQNADEASLSGIKGITSDIAKAIVAARNGNNRLESIADLLDLTPAQNQGRGRVPNVDAGSSGPKLVNEQLLMDIGDDITAEGQRELAGPININTASSIVLACLPGVSPDLAQAIVSYRNSNGAFPNIAWLLKVPGMTKEIFKLFAARVCARSETFRIISEGKVNSTGARQRIQVIVHIGAYDIDTLSYREDL
jgi:competence ComEA-like helix-hairpin-helix protein